MTCTWLAAYLGLLHGAEHTLAAAYRQVAAGHSEEADVRYTCQQLAGVCDQHEQALAPVVARYGEHPEDEPERLHAAELGETRSGGLGLLRDMQDLYLLANLVDITWTMVGQAARGLRDSELLQVVSGCEEETATQLKWLRTRMKQAAPQALIAAG